MNNELNNNVYEDYRGVSDVKIAQVIKDDGKVIEYGKPIRLAGAAEITAQTEQASEKKFYDNQARFNTYGVKDTNFSLSMSKPSDEVLALISGDLYQEDTGTTIGVDGKGQASFALTYKYGTTGGDEYATVVYKGTFDIPDRTHRTKDDSAGSDGITLTFTAVTPVTKQDVDGKKVSVSELTQKLDTITIEEFQEEILSYTALKELIAESVKK